MNRSYGVFLGRLSGLSILLGSACLIIAMLLTTAGVPASAADSLDEFSPTQEETVSPTPACTPPADWDQTVRLVAPQRTSKEWSFDIDEPEMFVVLEFIYYQDYDRSGCPFDCITGACQTDETGQGDSPLGGFTISDGQLGAHDGKVHLTGTLVQGSYQARFWVTGQGSINIGLRVHRSILPTDTPVPPDTDTPTPTQTEIPPSETSTPTFTATSTATSTPTGTRFPSQTPTPTVSFTPTASPPPTRSRPSQTPTQPLIRTEPPRTPTSTVPSVPELTTTPTSTLITLQTPAGTLPPPTPPSDFIHPPIIVPVTGAEMTPATASARFIPIFLNLGIGLLGVGLVASGLARWLRREDESLG